MLSLTAKKYPTGNDKHQKLIIEVNRVKRVSFKARKTPKREIRIDSKI